MTTQYTPTLKLALPVTGELSGTWGDVVNDNITSMIEQAIAGLATINTWTGNAHTLTTANGTTSESRCAMIVAATGGGAPSAAAEIICPAAAKLYVLQNNTSYAVTLKTSAGTGVAVAAGDTAFLFCDGTNVNSCVTTIVNGHITGNLTVDGNATINGNTTLGNATSDTVTVTARVASNVLPSADNTYDLGSSGNSWKDLWIDGTATMALVAVSGGTINGVSIGATTPATFLAVDNLSLDGNTIASTNTNGNIVIAPNGTGDVYLDADTVRVGDSGAAATLTSNGAGALTVTTGGAADLTLSTNSGTTSGTITITNGANANITLTPNGTGDVILSADTTQIGDSNTDATLTTNGTGSLNLTTNNGTNSGTIQIAQGANGNITLTPNGTGSVSISKLYSSGNTTLGASTSNTLSVAALVNSNLLFTDATYDIGATGANRPRDMFLSRNLTVGGTLTLAGGVNLNGNVTIGDASSDTLTINSTITSNLIFTDNTYDIGASGATRPRSIFLAGNATVGGLTSGRVTFAGTGGLLSDSANLTWNGTTLAVIGRLYNGDASTFAASTWAMSLGNGGVSANYFKASTTYWQDNSGTQIMQLNNSGLIVQSPTSSNAVISLIAPSYDTFNLTLSGAALTYATASTTAQRWTINGGEIARMVYTGQLGVGLTPSNNSYNIQSYGGVRAGTSVVAQGSLVSYTGPGVFLSYESYGGRLEAYDYATSTYKNISIVPNSGVLTVGAAAGNITSTLPLQAQTGIAVANGLYTFGTWTTNSTGDVILTSNAYPANIGSNSNIVLKLGTSGGGGPNEVARFVSTGNVGFGYTPNSWGNGYVALQISGAGRAFAGTGAGSGDLTLAFNAYYDSVDNRWEYVYTGDPATRYATNGGAHYWYTAAVGTANAAVSFTQGMTLDASSRLLIGSTSAAGSLGSGTLQVGSGFAGITNTGSVVAPTIVTSGSLEFNIDGVSGTQRHGRITGNGSTVGGAYAGGVTIEYYGYSGSAYQWYAGIVLGSAGAVNIGSSSKAGSLVVSGTGTVGTFTSSGLSSSATLMVQAENGAGYDARLYLECPGSNGGGFGYIRSNSRLYAWSQTQDSGPYVVANGTSWTTNSDARLKTNVQNIVYGLDAVLALAPKEYEYKVDEGKKCLGFIAQDVVAIIPELVDVPDDTNEMMGIEYQAFIPVLVKAIQELKAEFDAYKASHP